MGWFLAILIAVNLIMIAYTTLRLRSLFKSQLIMLLPMLSVGLFIATRFFGVNDIIWLSKLASYSYALLLCAILTSIIIDIALLLNKLLLRYQIKQRVKQISYLTLLFSMFAYGIFLATVPQTVFYSINIDKPAGIDKLRVVHLSDIHIHEITGVNYIKKLVERVNVLNPDIILITGDILDSRLKPFLDQGLSNEFAQLKSRYGTVVVFGNHEYIGLSRSLENTPDDVLNVFTSGKMRVLQDQLYTLPGTSITLIGRDDYAASMLNKDRKSLQTLIAGIDIEKTPLLLLDHQPHHLDDAANNNIDIMFSGHTHAGQIFPGTLLVNSMYQNPWGIYHQNRESGHPFISIVTSGYGLWGPPIRLLTRAEIVVADISFDKQ